LVLTSPAAAEDDVAGAAETLGAVVRAAPKNAAARLLLADAYEKLGNRPAAEEQFRLASEIAPDDRGIALAVARVAAMQGEREVPARGLDRVAAAKDLAPEQAERAAFLFALQGDRGRTIELLEPLASRSAAGRDAKVLLARLYADVGRLDRAGEL